MDLKLVSVFTIYFDFFLVKTLRAFNKNQSKMVLLKNPKKHTKLLFSSGIAKSILPIHFLYNSKNSLRILS